ncbi:putative neutral ceramidase C [Ptychodera flava]|uniref:putative neutral ceramidase C n=1 Tax=Ptychodera flava TaxID=63121 RepID=UPI003969F195
MARPIHIIFTCVFAICTFANGAKVDNGGDLYKIGVGIADCTGPAAETNMMGYATPSQTTKGIHQRLFSRAYIVADHDDDSNRFVFVSADIAMGAQIVKLQVIENLEEKYPGMYNDQNIAFSGQHTHSGPAGYQQYLLYDITSLGFMENSFLAIVEGVEKSIERAHENLQAGYIYSNRGELVDPSGVDKHWANRNRSPYAYEANPKEERDRYEHEVDKTMTLLKFVAEDGTDLGAITWFAVHTTSMNRTNHLISGDNKGYASYLMEQDFNDGARPGKGSFVAAFAQSNNGDVTPNIKDPHCLDAGEGSECDYQTSSCPGQDVCVAFGEGEDIFESTEINGRKQYDKAMELYKSATTALKGKVDFRHQYVDMSDYEVELDGGEKIKTCKPAMGYSFAAGTIDGPGAFNFSQGDTTGDPFWDSVRDFLMEPSQELMDCHEPKPILLPTGEATSTWEWHPTIVDTQILTIGSFVILAVPAEYSTMAGRRLRESIKQTFVDNGFPEETEVVIAGLCNVYTHYVVTYEEYQIQRYEAASMIYGPHTGHAYKQQYALLAEAIAKDESLPSGPNPPNFYKDGILWGIQFPVFIDDNDDNDFGTVLRQPEATYNAGDRVNVSFQAGNPRNDLKLEDTYLEVRRATEQFDWEVVYTDADWCTRFYWLSQTRRYARDLLDLLREIIPNLPPFIPVPDPPESPTLNISLPENFSLPLIGVPGTGSSVAEIIWDIPADARSGAYSICHYGDAISTLLDRDPQSYSGCTVSFDVIGSTVPTETVPPDSAPGMLHGNGIIISLMTVIAAMVSNTLFK